MSFVPHPRAFQLVPPKFIPPEDLTSRIHFDRTQPTWCAPVTAPLVDRILAEKRADMKWDPTAAELFKTVYTSIDPKAAKVGTEYNSIHELIAGDGTLHFHPETQGNQAASERILILYPYGNGAEFEWAGLQNPQPYRDDGKERNCVRGDIQDPHYSLKLQPGEVTLVNLFSGAHAFRGDTLALSIHPLDIVESDDVDTGITRTGDPMMDNTWEYVGKDPDSAEKITPESFEFKAPEEPVNLEALMAAHLETAQRLLEQGVGRAKAEDFVAEFRAPFEDGPN